MGYLYSLSRKTFTLYGAVNEVKEMQYGKSEHGHIYYPGVNTCTTITLLLSDSSALGIHVTVGDPVELVDAFVAKLEELRAGRTINALYAVGVLEYVGSGWKSNARYAWPTQLATFNTAFGRNGSDVVQGYKQPFILSGPGSGGRDYRGLIVSGGGSMAWVSRPQLNGKALGPWENLTTAALS